MVLRRGNLAYQEDTQDGFSFMDSISISTVYDCGGTSSPPARRKHSSIACDPCRRLKIRCIGGDPGTVSSSSISTPCVHCARLGKGCQWPEEDGRKHQETAAVDAIGLLRRRGGPPSQYQKTSEGDEVSPALSSEETHVDWSNLEYNDDVVHGGPLMLHTV